MKILAGMAIGITAVIVWHLLGWPIVGALFNDRPATPAGHTPKYRTWRNGVEQWPSSPSASTG